MNAPAGPIELAAAISGFVLVLKVLEVAIPWLITAAERRAERVARALRQTQIDAECRAVHRAAMRELNR